jgi:hypothetical protein
LHETAPDHARGEPLDQRHRHGERRLLLPRQLSGQDGAVLDEMTTTIPLSGAIDAADDILAGRVRGRTVVDVRA